MRSDEVFYLSIHDARVSIKTGCGEIRLGRGLSNETVRLLAEDLVARLNDGIPLDDAAHQIEAEGRRIESIVKTIDSFICGSNGWSFLSRCLVECEDDLSAANNLKRLFNRMIEEIDLEVGQSGGQFHVYSGISEDMTIALHALLQKPFPIRMASNRRIRFLPQLRCYVAWKLSFKLSGFPAMPAECERACRVIDDEPKIHNPFELLLRQLAGLRSASKLA